MSIQRLIDGVPSEEFYSTFHYTKILKLLGYDGPAKAGAYVRCPKCKTASMLVSSLLPFEGWMYCDKCKLACEGLQLYGQAYKISNPEELIDAVAKDLKVKSVNVEDKIAYSTFYNKQYLQLQKTWQVAKAAMHPVANRLASGRLNELNLWLGQEVFNRGLAAWFGFGFKHELEELLQSSIPGIGKSPDGLLVIPFYIKPGFISGFGFIGNKDHMSYLNLLEGHGGGFCGLNECHKHESESVHVLTHPLQAARIVQKCAVERYNKLSIVAKTPIGELEPLLLNKPTVMWVDDPDSSFMKTCIKARNFKVMIDDTPYIWKPTEKVSKMWEGSFMPSVHAQIKENNLLDPLDFLVTELLTMGSANARNVIDGLELTEFQKNLILASCTDEVREEIAPLLNHILESQPLVLDKKIFFERDGKLWIQGSREVVDEIVCNAIVRISHICRIKQGGAAAIFGKLIFEGKEISFQIAEDDIEEHPGKVLAYIAASAGLPKQPFVADSISKKYLDIIMRLSSPEVHSAQNYVGFDSDTGRFNLPRVSIDTDQIRVGVPFVMSEVEPPCSNVIVEAGLTVKKISNIFEHGPETVAYLGAMASLVAGIHNLIDNKPRTNLMLVGNKGSLAEYIFDILRIDLGLEHITLSSRDDVEMAQAVAEMHQVPVAIDGIRSRAKLLAEWAEGAKNSIVLANSTVASAMAADKDWEFLRADIEFTEETRALINSENVFPFFMQYALTVRPTSSHSMLDSLKYLAKSLDLNPGVLDSAKVMLSAKGYINTKSSGVQLINFIQEGVEQGMFKMFTGDSAKKRYVVLKNPMEDTVSIDLTNLLGQMRFYNLPVVTWESAVGHLKSLGAIEAHKEDHLLLVFPKPLWNSLVAAIKRMRSLRRAALTSLIELH
jgi:hypothetical protein